MTSSNSSETPYESTPPEGADEPVTGPAATSLDSAADPRSATESHRPTRTGAVWVAVASALLLLVLLVVFILQNQADVEIKFLGWSGTTPVGVALLVAAVAAGVLVGIAATARMIQLRRRARRSS